MRHAFGTKVRERKFERAVQELSRNRIEIASKSLRCGPDTHLLAKRLRRARVPLSFAVLTAKKPAPETGLVF
jgi:hypothetical protein